MPIPQPDKETIELWPTGAPGALGTESEDRPSLTLYPAYSSTATGASIVVLPGGGYQGHADHEARPIAEWLNSIGIFAAVLQYRLGPRYRHPCMLADASRAIQTVRARASAWKIDPERVGILGFSAGGHLTSMASVHYTSGEPQSDDPISRQSSRPNVSVLMYAVLDMSGKFGHEGSRLNLLGPSPSNKLLELATTRNHITPDTPPTLLIGSVDDAAVPIENSLEYAMALSQAKVPYQLLAYQDGGHGFGLGVGSPVLSRWTDDATLWLRGHQF